MCVLVQASVAYDPILDSADLDLEQGYSEPELCFARSQVRDPAYALLDSGATCATSEVICFQEEPDPSKLQSI